MGTVAGNCPGHRLKRRGQRLKKAPKGNAMPGRNSRRTDRLRGCALLLAAVAQAPRATPYMASIASGRAMMRLGPGQTYPGIWLFAARPADPRDPVHGDWRQIQDPDGTTAGCW